MPLPLRSAPFAQSGDGLAAKQSGSCKSPEDSTDCEDIPCAPSFPRNSGSDSVSDSATLDRLQKDKNPHDKEEEREHKTHFVVVGILDRKSTRLNSSHQLI